MKKQRVVCIPQASPEPGSIYDCIPLIPETHLLFAGPLACARHGLLSGANYFKEGRISYLLTNADEAADGSYVHKIIDCASEIKKEKDPQALVILLCCSDVILATDTDALRDTLEKKAGIPVRFMVVNRLNMYAKGDKPLMFPTQLEMMCSLLRAPRKKDRAVNLIGTLLSPDRNDPLFKALNAAGYEVRLLSGQKSFKDYQAFSDSALDLALTQEGAAGCEYLESNYGIPWLPFYSGYRPEDMAGQYRAVSESLGVPVNTEAETNTADMLLDDIKDLLYGNETVINAGMMKAPWSLTRALVERGVKIDTLFYTRFSGKEPQHRKWLEEKAPEIKIVKADSILEKLPKMPFREKITQYQAGYFGMIGDLKYLKAQLEEQV